MYTYNNINKRYNYYSFNIFITRW